ncbi:MAG: hypothetical protein ABSC29_00890 [Minisyncoccia bacterium]|jgi:hypothetical protein
MVSELKILNLAFVPLSDEDDKGLGVGDEKDLEDDEEDDVDGVTKEKEEAADEDGEDLGAE